MTWIGAVDGGGTVGRGGDLSWLRVDENGGHVRSGFPPLSILLTPHFVQCRIENCKDKTPKLRGGDNPNFDQVYLP